MSLSARRTASMGPPSEDDGKEKMAADRNATTLASMGPPSEDDGKEPGPPVITDARRMLQWGRRPRTTESRRMPPV